jgi:pimeloyl-ACP methyl ester carboxylesterase
MASLAGLGGFASVLDSLTSAFPDDLSFSSDDDKKNANDSKAFVTTQPEASEGIAKGQEKGKKSGKKGKGKPGKQAKGGDFIDLAEARGLHIKYSLKGPEDAPKLLYIPGVTDDLRKTLSSMHCDAFAKKFRTLTCDLRNQGETWPFEVDAYVPLETYVGDLVALADSIFGPDTSFHVVGWSFGAALALLMARLHPNRVSSIAVLAGGYWEPQESHIGNLSPNGETLFGKDWQWINVLSSYVGMTTDKRCEKMLCHADVRRMDFGFRKRMLPTFEWHLDNFVRSEDTTVMKSPRTAQKLGQGVLLQEIALYAEGTPHVEDISTPTIIIHGRHDGMHAVERAMELKKKMSGAMLVVLEDEGHVIVTAAVDTAAAFLQPPTILHRRLQNMPAWSYECANAALEKIGEEYNKEDVQKRLDAVFENPRLLDHEKEVECHRICSDVQRLILDKPDLPGSSVDTADDEEGASVVDLMIRRLAALESMTMADRKKAFDKRRTAPFSKSRSELYSMQQMHQKTELYFDPADQIRRSLHLSMPAASHQKPKVARVVGWNMSADLGRVRKLYP